MAPNKKKVLRAGKGAVATILPKYVAPKVDQAEPGCKEQSRVILVDRFEASGKVCYSFYFENGGDKTKLFNASCCYVTIVEEGNLSQFFAETEAEAAKRHAVDTHGSKQTEEPKEGWKKSKARKLLFDDIRQGIISLDAKVDKDLSMKVFDMHIKFADWDFNKFANRIKGVQKIIKQQNAQANDDKAAFENFCENHEPSKFSHHGYIQWQGSEAQKLVQKHLKDGTIGSYTKEKYDNPKMEYWLSRSEFCDEFPLSVFRDKIRQEQKTAKYHNTLTVRGKKETYKYSN